MTLTDDDYAALQRSFINRELADAAGIYRVTSIEGRDLVGRRGAGDFSGLLFPYKWPGTPDVVLNRLRLDSPPVDVATGKPQHKYLSAAGDRNHLYFPPCTPKLAEDTTVPVVITEGEKKTLSLWRAALESGNGAGRPAFLPIGIPGVWNFRGTVGLHTTAGGKHVPEKGVIPDFDRIPWKQRRVTILFDVNAASNPSVSAARRELARELSRREAEVYLADLPESPEINGCDDYLARFGVQKLLAILNQVTRYDWRTELLVNDKGAPIPVLANILTVLRSAPEWCGVLAFNEFSLEISARRAAPWGQITKWADVDSYRLQDWLQHQGLMVRIGDVQAAVEAAARDSNFHPVRNYLDGLVWDGVYRTTDWLAVYFGTATDDLTRAFGEKWLISAVARIFEPGCQVDHTLILEGPQGTRKSTAMRTLGEPFFTDDIPELGTKDAALCTAGSWIIELAELDALTRAEVSKIKSFVTRRMDRYRPPYAKHVVEVPRQCVFCGTVNLDQYLRDETGGRRFWPVRCGRIDLDALRRDRDELWAEAVTLYRRGEPWWLETEKLVQAAAEEQDARFQRDPWESTIHEWLQKREDSPDFASEVTTAGILLGPLNKRIGDWSRADEMRVAQILRRCGWELAGRPGTAGPRPRVYRPNVQSDQPK
jgi:predicted P-loop ATPase